MGNALPITVLVALALLLVGRWLLRPYFSAGPRGERQIAAVLRSRLPEADYTLFHDVTLHVEGGTTQIDHVVISRFGVFVIETKNMSGWIFGEADKASWTQVIYGHKTQFQNPLRQNHGHVKALEKSLGIPAAQLFNIVAFVGDAVPKTGFPGNVLWDARAVADYILFRSNPLFDIGQVSTLVAALNAARLAPGKATRQAHVVHVRDQQAKRALSPRCPRCGADMKIRANRKSGERFWGCSRYPACRGALPYRETSP